MMSMMTFGQIFPVIPAIIKSLIVGKKVLDVIDRVPEIRSPEAGSKVDSTKISIDSGIHFKDVHFRYPTAPEGSKDVFSGVNFSVKPYTSTAIVGPSGSGKSTIV